MGVPSGSRRPEESLLVPEKMASVVVTGETAVVDTETVTVVDMDMGETAVVEDAEEAGTMVIAAGTIVETIVVKAEITTGTIAAGIATMTEDVTVTSPGMIVDMTTVVTERAVVAAGTMTRMIAMTVKGEIAAGTMIGEIAAGPTVTKVPGDKIKM